MTYEEQISKARTAGASLRVTHSITQWEEEGQRVFGKLLSIEPFESPKYDQVCNQYLIDTDTGRTSCVLGKATDFYLENAVAPGDLIAIEYQGKKDLGDGRKVNQFQIDVIPQQK